MIEDEDKIFEITREEDKTEIQSEIEIHQNPYFCSIILPTIDLNQNTYII